MILPYINTTLDARLNNLIDELPKNINENTIFVEPHIGEKSIFLYMVEKYGLRNIIINHPDPDVALIYTQIKSNIMEVVADFDELTKVYNSIKTTNKNKLYNGILQELEVVNICPVLKSVYLIFIHTVKSTNICNKSTLFNLHANLQKVHIINQNPNDIILNEENILYYINRPKGENAATAANSLNYNFFKIITDMNQKILMCDGFKNY